MLACGAVYSYSALVRRRSADEGTQSLLPKDHPDVSRLKFRAEPQRAVYNLGGEPGYRRNGGVAQAPVSHAPAEDRRGTHLGTELGLLRARVSSERLHHHGEPRVHAQEGLRLAWCGPAARQAAATHV